MKLLFVLLLVFGAAALAEKLYGILWSRRLCAAVSFQPEPAVEGETAVLLETIENRKRLPLAALKVEFPVEHGLGLGEEENASRSDKQYKRDVFSVGGFQKISREIPFLCRRRGYYQIDRLDLCAEGLWMKETYYLEKTQDTYLYVYPRKIPSGRLKLPMHEMGGLLEQQRGIVEDPLAFAGIRDYDTTDPMSRINWKASARQGRLMVNQYHSSCSMKVTCFLDVENLTIWNHREVHEESIRLAASMLGELIRQGISVELLSNGVDCLSGERIRIPDGSGRGQTEKLNRSLSRLRLDEKLRLMPIRELVEAEEKRLSASERLLLLITENRSRELEGTIERLAGRGTQALWVGVAYRNETWEGPKAKRVSYVKWEVEHEG